VCAIENGNQDGLDFENGPRCRQRRISHKRTIGSLASLTKKKLIEMMVKHDVEYIDLPITDSRLEHANDENEAIEDRGVASVLLLILRNRNKRRVSQTL
jgi:hypothetical protein